MPEVKLSISGYIHKSFSLSFYVVYEVLWEAYFVLFIVNVVRRLQQK